MFCISDRACQGRNRKLFIAHAWKYNAIQNVCFGGFLEKNVENTCQTQEFP